MKKRYLASLLSATALTAGIAAAVDSEASSSAAGVPASYPLKKCPISDEALGSMGEPVKVTYKGADVYLCCKGCVKNFNEDPSKHSKAVENAAARK